ncbi:MAG: helix-turn-helix domain-containing protein [Holosporales bacterium]|jgi:predicted transcriptional regulator
MKTLAAFRAEALKNPKVRRAYEAMTPEFALAAELLRARLEAGLTQEEVATRMQTTQSVVARLESGTRLPSMQSLVRYAAAIGMRPDVRLVPSSL